MTFLFNRSGGLLLIAIILSTSACLAMPGRDTIPGFDGRKVVAALLDKNAKELDNEDIDKDSMIGKNITPILRSYEECLTDALKDKELKLRGQMTFRRPVAKAPVVRHWLSPGDGYVQYLSTYRGFVDTPFAEKNIIQQNITGQFGFTVAESVPLQLRVWSRTSNSGIFRDIFDVQLMFDAAGFSRGVMSRIQDVVRQKMDSVKGLSERPEELAWQKWINERRDWLQSPVIKDQLIRYNEFLRIDAMSFDKKLSDSLNLVRKDSLQREAKFFLDKYQQVQQSYDSLRLKYDSIAGARELLVKKLAGVKTNALREGKAMTDSLTDLGIAVSGREKLLSGIRQVGIGKMPVHHSELTARNLSVNGVNLVYQRGVYLAFTAGGIDYRFRDFSFSGLERVFQPFIMARVGVGDASSKQLILSYYNGKKQLFGGTGAAQSTAMGISGVSLEGKYRLHRSTTVTGEFAQSYAPDISASTAGKGRFAPGDKSSQAYHFSFQSFFPLQGLSAQGFYRKNGARFQSFNSFQTNAAQEAWSVKLEKTLWQKRLKVLAGLRKNEFSNPLIPQRFSTGMVFKNLALTLRVPKLPIVSLGYQPHAQLVMIDSAVYEYHFQSLQAMMMHQYRVGESNVMTTVGYNRFSERGGDSSSIYFGSSNILFTHSVDFGSFGFTVSYNASSGASFDYKVMEKKLELSPIPEWTLEAGVRIHNYDKAITKIGAGGAVSRRFGMDILSFRFDEGYLPAYRGGLVKNRMASLQYMKRFDFKHKKH